MSSEFISEAIIWRKVRIMVEVRFIISTSTLKFDPVNRNRAEVPANDYSEGYAWGDSLFVTNKEERKGSSTGCYQAAPKEKFPDWTSQIESQSSRDRQRCPPGKGYFALEVATQPFWIVSIWSLTSYDALLPPVRISCSTVLLNFRSTRRE